VKTGTRLNSEKLRTPILQNRYMYIYIAALKLQVNSERIRNMRNGEVN